VYFGHDVLRGHLAEFHLILNSCMHRVDIVVHHRQRNEYGKYGDKRECDGRVGDEGVRLFTVIRLHDCRKRGNDIGGQCEARNGNGVVYS
jgi:hypothetical protein